MKSRELSRRDFLLVSGGSALALGLLHVGLPQLRGEGSVAHASGTVQEWPVIWLQLGTCTGCSVTVLNSLSPKIQSVLVDEVLPDQHISLRYHATIMTAEGEQAIKALEDTAEAGGYVLVVEGAVSTSDDGVYCEIGEDDSGQGITGLRHVIDLGTNAVAVVALGTCAAYGGIPAIVPPDGTNPTGSVGVNRVFDENGVSTPVINIPGCPPHPDWFVGTLASIIRGGLEAVEVDEYKRPVDFFGKRVHEYCPRYSYFEAGKFSTKLSDPYCMYRMGCRGPVTSADCPKRLWNSGTSWCIGANSLCIGCVEPGFPTALPFRSEIEGDWQLSLLETEESTEGFSPVAAAVLGAGVTAGAGLAGIAIYATQGSNNGPAEGEDA